MKQKIVMLLMGTMLITSTVCGTFVKADAAKVHTDVRNEQLAIKGTPIVDEESDNKTIAGGWSIAKGKKQSKRAEAALNKALDGLVGADYEQIKLLATQIVSGTNYAILCKITSVYPGAEGDYSIVYVYEDLEGNAEITRIQDLVEGNNLNADGAFTTHLSKKKLKTANKVWKKATKNLEGAMYQSVKVLGYQVVEGTNYKYLCKITPVVPNAEAAYQVVTVYKDLKGKIKITDITKLEYSIDEVSE